MCSYLSVPGTPGPIAIRAARTTPIARRCSPPPGTKRWRPASTACACCARSVSSTAGAPRAGSVGRQTNIPEARFTAVDTGGLEACGLREDRTIACWGDLHRGLTYGGTPEVPEGRFTAPDVGWKHSCAVRDDGTVKCWADSFGSEQGQADPPDGRFTQVAVG